MRWRFVHEMVDKTETYVKGRVHVNSVENFWTLLKRGLNGTYVAVEPYHLERYVDEQVFRYNNRATPDNPLNDADRFDAAVRQIVRQAAHIQRTHWKGRGKASGSVLIHFD